ncbi:MAG: HAMP domain-containing sensor histidine kinase, partial [Planctomycetota bacterium]
ASIKAYAEMLADGDVADEKGRDEFYEIILNEADRLSNLIDNILNISRIESGLVEIDRKPTSPVLIAEKALGVIEPQAKLKNITVHRQLLPSMYQVTADEDLLYQVMLNLLSNAVKYTPDGGSVTLAIEADESGGRIATRVVDTGAGIPAEDLPRVFEKFYRVKQNNALAKGTGLGLPLVKRVIEEDHDGQLIAESEPGKGSTFGFYLPMAGKSSVEATEETDMTQQGQSRVEVSPSDSGSVSKEAA